MHQDHALPGDRSAISATATRASNGATTRSSRRRSRPRSRAWAGAPTPRRCARWSRSLGKRRTSSRMDALDVIAIGRCSVDLYGQQIGSRLEDIATFAKSVGGSPANMAIGTSRLGTEGGPHHPRRRRADGALRARADAPRRGRAAKASAPIRSGSPRWCCSRSRTRAFRRRFSIAPIAPTWRCPRTTSTRRSSPRRAPWW